jgi:flavorubredoxin
METRVDEIADRIYRLSTFVPDVGPTGFTFNQFLIDADEPAIFHTGPRAMFPTVSAALASVLPLERLRWIMFGHLEADECGAMNLFLAAAPDAHVAHTARGCMVSINDLADRPPVPIAPDDTFDVGGRRVRSIDTPHVPHGWDAHVLYEETTGTLFCGDLFSQVGDVPALTTATCLTPPCRPRTCSAPPASRPPRRPPSAGSPSSNPRRLPSCTAHHTRARPARPFWRSPRTMNTA